VNTYIIRRRSAWKNAQELETTAGVSLRIGNDEMAESATRRPRPAKLLFQQIHHSLHSLDTDAQIPV
jgi:hypothetical protein